MSRRAWYGITAGVVVIGFMLTLWCILGISRCSSEPASLPITEVASGRASVEKITAWSDKVDAFVVTYHGHEYMFVKLGYAGGLVRVDD